jgi:uncharacterized protein (DUF302 family)/glutaredoxin
VRKKLDQLGLRYLIVPVEKNGGEREELKKISGQQAVPVLVDKGKVVTDSQSILKHLNKMYGDENTEVMESNEFGLHVKLEGDFSEVVTRTTEALKKEGFGVLTDIDVKATLKKKIDVDIPHQTILGTCNPNLAHQALGVEKDLGLLLPCNVVVREAEPGSFLVSAVNPLKLLAIAGRNDLLPIAFEVKSKLNKVIENLAA